MVGALQTGQQRQGPRHYSTDTPAHVDENGLHQNVLGKVLKLLGHSGREQQRLPLLLEVVHDLLDLCNNVQKNKTRCHFLQPPLRKGYRIVEGVRALQVLSTAVAEAVRRR